MTQNIWEFPLSALSIVSDEPILAILILGILALVIGSFLNVVIYRLPLILEQQLIPSHQTAAENKKLSLYLPSSHCPQCKHNIKVQHNIPIIGYLLLRGRCAECNAEISMRYPAVELITLLLSLVVAVKLGPDWKTAAGLLLTWILISLAFIDLETFLLPDELTLPLMWIGLLLSISGLFTDTTASILGATVGYLIFWLLNKIFLLLTNKQGMGYGDMKLTAALGAWFGVETLPFIIMLASLLGLMVALALMLMKKVERGQKICFGPYLCISAWLYLLFDDTVTQILSLEGVLY